MRTYQKLHLGPCFQNIGAAARTAGVSEVGWLGAGFYRKVALLVTLVAILTREMLLGCHSLT